MPPLARTEALGKAQRLMQSGMPVGMSLAPSFPAHFPEDKWELLPKAIRHLGFRLVEPANAVLPEVIKMRAEELSSGNGEADRVQISGCCPRVVNLIERCYPLAMAYLSSVPSPMTLHARRMRQRLGEPSAVVFAGPCPDKQAEAERPENRGAADVVLIFSDLSTWLSLERAWERADSGEGWSGQAPFWTYYCVLVNDMAGMERCHEMLPNAHLARPGFYELLACARGCLGGGGLGRDRSDSERADDIRRYAAMIRACETGC